MDKLLHTCLHLFAFLCLFFTPVRPDTFSVEGPCSSILNFLIPCKCSMDSTNATGINCNEVSFQDFPVLPHRQKITSYSQSNAGLQSLEAQLFTASDIPLRKLDFSNNLLRQLTEKVFEGIEDTLAELILRGNKLGDQLHAPFATNEFHNLKNLRKLDLSKNEIKDFQAGVFNGLHNLEELMLHENYLAMIPRAALHPLHALKSLHLQSNYILDIGFLSFPNLTSIQFLNLSSNDIVSVQDGAFASLPKLTTLILSKNQLKHLDPRFLDGISLLEHLDLSNNLLEELMLTLSNNLPLKKLMLQANKIRSLNKITLSSFTTLEYLDLRRNRILEIAPGIFAAMPNLKELHLDVNTVRKVTRQTFAGLEALSDMTMSDNIILAFPTESLSIFQNLRKLSLDYNRIAAISQEILAPVRKNKELSLAFNLIREIPDGTFMQFNSLELLNLHGNKISNFTMSKTQGLKDSLLFLDIGYNEITEVPQLDFPNLIILSVSRNKISAIRPDALSLLKNLMYFNISYNLLSDFPSGLFREHRNLENIDMKHNVLSSIPSGGFRDLPVVHIDLKHNQLHDIKESTFVNMPKLRYLDLSENKLKMISKEAFVDLPNVELLDLKQNKLSRFTGEEFDSVTKIKKLILSYNKIASVNSNSFKMFPNIRLLDLAHNELSYFSYESIMHLDKLVEIKLDGNKFHFIGHLSFSNLPKLKTVHLENNLITNVSETAFFNSSNLNSIHLQNNKISSLSDHTFETLNRIELDLSNNSITTLPENIFSHMKGIKLQSINLARNNLREFPSDALKKQYSYLEKVNVSHNRIQNLPSNSDVLVNIKELDLSYNPLTPEAHHVLFNEPKSVRKLHVEGTNIVTMPVMETPFLQVLNLKNNRLPHIRPDIFYRTSMLMHLDLSDNKISTVDFLSPVGRSSYLQTLDVSSNPIIRITKSSLNYFPNLRHLKLKKLKNLVELSCDNFLNMYRLRKLEMHGFPSLADLNVRQCLQNVSGLEALGIEIKEFYLKEQLQTIFSPKLERVSITGSKLRSISSSTFAGMFSPAIKIKLSDTSLDTFSDKIFFPLPLSSNIEFSIPHNKIHRLSPDVLSAIDNKQINVVISGLNANPISCDCHLRNLWKWLQDRAKTPVVLHPAIAELQNLACSEPHSLRGQRVLDLKEIELTCENFDSSLTSTSEEPTPTTSAPLREKSSENDLSYIIFQSSSTKKPHVPASHVPSSADHSTLTKVDTMIIGIVGGVVAFVCILIIIICIIRLRRTHPLYMAGPLAGPLAFRAQGKCTCLKPPVNSCTCYPMYPMTSSRMPGMQMKGQPQSLPQLPGLVNSGSHPGMMRGPPYYVTYPESENENR